MAKKPLITKKTTESIIVANNSDTLYLQNITRKLLVNLERIAERLEFANDEELTDIKICHELLFGQKSSLAGALVILSDLLLKLTVANATENNPVEGKDDAWLERISDIDIALVESFIHKLKNHQKTPPDDGDI
jgi:hypothetical protein